MTARDPLVVGLRRTIVVAIVLIAVNDSLPYLGLRDESCQTMFSGLAEGFRRNNHRFIGQHSLSDVGVYLSGVRAEVTPQPVPNTTSAFIADWLTRADLDHNLEAMRSVVARLCDERRRVALSFASSPSSRESVTDACSDPRFAHPHAWIPVRLFDPSYPASPDTENFWPPREVWP